MRCGSFRMKVCHLMPPDSPPNLFFVRLTRATRRPLFSCGIPYMTNILTVKNNFASQSLQVEALCNTKAISWRTAVIGFTLYFLTKAPKALSLWRVGRYPRCPGLCPAKYESVTYAHFVRFCKPSSVKRCRYDKSRTSRESSFRTEISGSRHG
jgi:hypothetical protein